MHIAQIEYRSDLKKHVLVLNGKIIAKSAKARYLERCVDEQWGKAKKHKITKWVRADQTHTIGTATPAAALAPKSFDINQRFDLMGEVLDMVIQKDAKSVIIAGPGGLGKTYEVLAALKKHNLVDCRSLQPTIEDLEMDDSDSAMERKVTAAVTATGGDYAVIKGHSSAAALYRILYENKDRLVVFDDCDAVLNDGSSLNLLKGALDSYDERWISWWTERSFGDNDLPKSFKFKGAVIFITNKPMERLDEALKTRAFKIDLAMDKQERLDRMAAVVGDVMPDVDLHLKFQALKFLSEHRDLTDDINFRTLMGLITIRASKTTDWKRLAKFSLLQGN